MLVMLAWSATFGERARLKLTLMTHDARLSQLVWQKSVALMRAGCSPGQLMLSPCQPVTAGS